MVAAVRILVVSLDPGVWAGGGDWGGAGACGERGEFLRCGDDYLAD